MSASTLRSLERQMAEMPVAGSTQPNDATRRFPVHVFYGGAHLFREDTTQKMGTLALRSLDLYAGPPEALADIFGLPAQLAPQIFARTRQKLGCQPIEDYRIDFEDGFGVHPDAEEDDAAKRAAQELTTALVTGGALPYSFGIRIKPFEPGSYRRGLRTLDIFFAELASRLESSLVERLRITLPKVSSPRQAAALDVVCTNLEEGLGLSKGSLQVELMVEQARAIFDSSGALQIRPLVAAANHRCIAVHFGPHDYAASRDLMTAQPLRHFSADVARELIQLGLSGTGTRVVDGPTTNLPIAPHAGPLAALSETQRAENRAAVLSAWRLHYSNIRHALENGFYAGWDLHPAQLPVRYIATYAFFLEQLQPIATRLRNLLVAAARATRVGQQFDDAAMAQEQIAFIRQALLCGALTAEEAEAATGLSEDELLRGTLATILAKRM